MGSWTCYVNAIFSFESACSSLAWWWSLYVYKLGLLHWSTQQFINRFIYTAHQSFSCEPLWTQFYVISYYVFYVKKTVRKILFSLRLNDLNCENRSITAYEQWNERLKNRNNSGCFCKRTNHYWAVSCIITKYNHYQIFFINHSTKKWF